MPHHPRARYWSGNLYVYPTETREHLISTMGGPCYLCGAEWGSVEFEAEHRVPKCRGGETIPANISWACRPCNRRKHRMTEAEFRRLLAWEVENPPPDGGWPSG